MKKFLIQLILFGSMLCTPILLWILYNIENLAQPKISTSHSFNEKLSLIKKTHATIITVGSSMSLNNVSSEEVLKYFNTTSYLNLSSWGINITEVRDLVKIYQKNHTLKCVIIASNYQDFRNKSIIYNTVEIEDYLHSDYDLLYYLKHFDVKYYYTFTQENKRVKTNNTIYESLAFDKYGGVPLSSKKFLFNKVRWNMELDPYTTISQNEFQELNKLCAFLSRNKIGFIFILTPVRKKIQTAQYLEAIELHRKKVAKILARYNFKLRDITKNNYPDSLFVDSFHLNELGAKVITRDALNQYNN